MSARRFHQTMGFAAVVAGVWTALSVAAAAQLAPAPPSGGTSSASRTPDGPAGLAPAPVAVRGLYLDAAPSVQLAPLTSDPARPFTLVVDITPKPGMRVYAPGNEGYAPLTLTIDPSAGLVVAPTVYPKPTEFLFAPLNERVKVFASSFRVTRVATRRPLSGSSPGESKLPTVITGRLEYQACDDKVCYFPQRLSLTWTVEP